MEEGRAEAGVAVEAGERQRERKRNAREREGGTREREVREGRERGKREKEEREGRGSISLYEFHCNL